MFTPALKKVALFCISLAFFLPFITTATPYTEGKQYTQISDKPVTKLEIKEYFSFYCPHCFKFEPLLAGVKKDLDPSVKFERNHVDFLRAAPTEIQHLLSKSIVMGQQLKIEEKIVLAIFNAIHVNKQTFSSETDVRNLFIANGVTGEKFDSLVKSFSVNSKANQMKKSQDELVKKGFLKSVPTLVINGKYRINTQALDRNNFEKDYKAIITYLLSID
jgi:thiol:disulfide interchange protein DsbA